MKPSIELAKLAIAYEQAFAVYFPTAKYMAELSSAVMEEECIRYWISPGGDSITCTKCRMTSRNTSDIENRYCGHCHQFHDETPQQSAREFGLHDAGQALRLFESMTSDQLMDLKRAHEIDLANATRAESIVFGAGRLGLIAEVLKRRSSPGGVSRGR